MFSYGAPDVLSRQQLALLKNLFGKKERERKSLKPVLKTFQVLGTGFWDSLPVAVRQLGQAEDEDGANQVDNVVARRKQSWGFRSKERTLLSGIWADRSFASLLKIADRSYKISHIKSANSTPYLTLKHPKER